MYAFTPWVLPVVVGVGAERGRGKVDVTGGGEGLRANGASCRCLRANPVIQQATGVQQKAHSSCSRRQKYCSMLIVLHVLYLTTQAGGDGRRRNQGMLGGPSPIPVPRDPRALAMMS